MSFWGLSLVKLLKRSVDKLKGNNFGGSTQPFGPLCLWQYSSFSLNCLNQYLVLSLFKESNFSHNLNFQSVSHSTLALDHVKLTQQQILGGLVAKQDCLTQNCLPPAWALKYNPFWLDRMKINSLFWFQALYLVRITDVQYVCHSKLSERRLDR